MEGLMENRPIIPANLFWLRPVAIVFCLLFFLLIYTFQRQWLTFTQVNLSTYHPYLPFILNRTVRLIVNDGLCLLLFVALFNRKEELKLATAVFLIELLIILPIYFVIKLSWEGDIEISSPLLSFVHRLIVNPLLMFVLMVGLLLQRYNTSGKVW
jgi:hypothetical protein